MPTRRRRLLIDRAVQLGLMRRLGVYGFYCLLTAILLVFFWRVSTVPLMRPHEHLLVAVQSSAPMMLSLACIVPFVAFDLLKLTNHFTGPIYRARRTLESLARGESIAPVKFRDGDYWCDLAAQLHQLAARLGQLQAPTTAHAAGEIPTPAAQEQSA